MRGFNHGASAGLHIVRRSIRELRSLPPGPAMRTMCSPALARSLSDTLTERAGPRRAELIVVRHSLPSTRCRAFGQLRLGQYGGMSGEEPGGSHGAGFGAFDVFGGFGAFGAFGGSVCSNLTLDGGRSSYARPVGDLQCIAPSLVWVTCQPP